MKEAEAFERLRELFGRLAEMPHAKRESELAALSHEPGLAAELREMLATLEGTDSPLDRPLLRARDDWALLPQIPGFRIERRLGRGGSATVYLARQERETFERDVALKVIDQAFGPDTARRVRDEMRILAKLEHPGIARLYDAGVTPAGQPYLAMERVEGTTIVEHCRERQLPVGDRVAVFLAVLEAVAFAHRAGVVHRDLKPGNILVTATGDPKLLDFGIAKRVPSPGDEEETRTVRRALTPSYASPEQIRGDRVTVASDVYSLGVVLYELLAEVLPYQLDGTRFELIEDAIRLQDPEAPSAALTRADPESATTRSADTQPLRDRREIARRRRELRGDLDAVVLKALRKDPAARYASVDEFSADLRRVAAGQPVAARGADRRYRAGRWFRRRFKVLVAAAILAPLVAIVAVPALRERLVLPLVTPQTADELSAFYAVGSGDAVSRRLLREGAARLRRGDGAGARESFRAAVERFGESPARAMALDGLSRAEASLGEVGRSAEAALSAEKAMARAPETSADDLDPEERERIAARGRAAAFDFAVAVPAFDRLFARHPHRIDIGLDLVAALLASGQTAAAAATLGRMEQLPSQTREALRDPRLDLAEAEVAYRLGEHQRAVAAATRASDRAAATGAAALRLRAERRRAEAFGRLDLPEEGRPELERIVAAADAAGLGREAAAARLALAKIYSRTPEEHATWRLLEAARSGLVAAGDRAGEVGALSTLAYQTSKSGDFGAALRLSREAVALSREIGDVWSEGEALSIQISILNWSGDAAGVLEARERTLAAMRESANHQTLFAVLCNLALDATERRELDLAQGWLEEAEGLSARVGGRISSAALDRARGFFEETRGDHDRARQWYEGALEKARRANVPVSIASYLDDLAWLEVAADRPDAAEARVAEAIAAHQAIGRTSDAADLEAVLAWIDAKRGDAASADRRLATLRTALPDDEGASFTLLTFEALVAEALADWPRAVRLRREAVRVADVESPEGVRIEQRYRLASALVAAGKDQEARQLARAILTDAEHRGLAGIARGAREILANE